MMKLQEARAALKTHVRPARDADILLVLNDMRASNAAELFATQFEGDSDIARARLADELNALRDRLLERWCFTDAEGAPIAVFCAWLASPGVAQILMVATDRWNEVALTGYLFCREVLYGRGLSGIHRCETMVMAGSDYRWLEQLGYVVEGVARARGKNREDFIRLAWVKPEDPHVRHA